MIDIVVAMLVLVQIRVVYTICQEMQYGIIHVYLYSNNQSVQINGSPVTFMHMFQKLIKVPFYRINPFMECVIAIIKWVV